MNNKFVKMNRQTAKIVNAYILGFIFDLSSVMPILISIREKSHNKSIEIEIENVTERLIQFMNVNEKTVFKIEDFIDINEHKATFKDLEKDCIDFSETELKQIIDDCLEIPSEVEKGIKKIIEKVKDLKEMENQLNSLKNYLSTSVANSKVLSLIISEYLTIKVNRKEY